MQAGDLADGPGQGVDQAAVGVGGQGQQSRTELADEPRCAVATAGAGPIGGAQAIQHHGKARGGDGGPVLVRGVLTARLGGDGGVH